MQLNDYKFDLGMNWKMLHKPQLDNSNHKFTQLKVVVLRSFKFLPSELELVKIILQRATILESLFLIPPKNGCSKFKRQDAAQYQNLFGSWRASTKVIVGIYEGYVDESVTNQTHSKLWIREAFWVSNWVVILRMFSLVVVCMSSIELWCHVVIIVDFQLCIMFCFLFHLSLVYQPSYISMLNFLCIVLNYTLIWRFILYLSILFPFWGYNGET